MTQHLSTSESCTPCSNSCCIGGGLFSFFSNVLQKLIHFWLQWATEAFIRCSHISADFSILLAGSNGSNLGYSNIIFLSAYCHALSCISRIFIFWSNIPIWCILILTLVIRNLDLAFSILPSLGKYFLPTHLLNLISLSRRCRLRTPPPPTVPSWWRCPGRLRLCPATWSWILATGPSPLPATTTSCWLVEQETSVADNQGH